jgi:hypothetical protein
MRGIVVAFVEAHSVVSDLSDGVALATKCLGTKRAVNNPLTHGPARSLSLYLSQG